MSKAFTSEETTGQAPLGRTAPRLAPGELRYVTPEGYAALRAELSRLEAERTTAEPGRAEALALRAATVESTLATLTVLTPQSAPEGKVGFGTWVTVEDGDGRRSTWRIVGADEADARRGLVSVGSPVARALLGREEGDEVVVERPGGRVALTVVAVRLQP